MFSPKINFLPQPLPGIASKASRVVLEFTCAASVAINDLVYQDSVNQSTAVECTDNTTVQPTIGVVIDKPTTTSCEVLVLGIQEGYTGLSIGSKIYLDTDGTVTTTKPSSGYMQVLGTAVATDTIFFLPNSQRVLQV